MKIYSSVLLLAIIVLTPACVFSQSTTVSGTITDTPDGQAWYAGTYSFVFRVAPNNPVGPYFWNGAPFSTSQTIAGSLDGSGHYSVSIPSNTSITPAGSSWDATFCPLATASCFTVRSVSVTGPTQTVAPSPPSIRISMASPPPNTRAYADGELVAGALGQQYFNTGIPATKVCSTLPCGWTSIGGGGSATAPFISLTTPPASTGTLRLGNNESGVCWRNSTNTGDVCITLTNLNTLTNVCQGTGPQGNLQAAGISSTCQSTNLNESGTTLTLDDDVRFKGINPYVDARRYGVRTLLNSNAIPAISGITATTTGGSPTVPVSTSNCIAQTGNVCFQNGDNVVLPNAGSAVTMGAANTPTVTPFNSRSGTGNADGVAAPASATSYNYKVFGVDIMHGTTAPSSVGSTATGASSLGEITYTVTSASWSQDTITFTGASNPGVGVGTVVIVDTPTGTGDGQFLGDWKVSSVSGTGFTVAGVGLDTREGGVKLASSGGFTAHFFNFNKVTWAATSPAAHFYGVCSDRATPGTYHLIGVSILPTNPVNGGMTIGTLEFDDYGASMPTSVGFWELSDANCSGSGTNDDWVATILSGAGTTTLTTTTNAPNSNGGGQPIRFDNTANYITAIQSSFLNAKSGVVVLPLDSGGAYVFNAPLNTTTLSTGHVVLSMPQGAVFNSTFYLKDEVQLYCDLYPPGTGSDTSFESKSSPNISFFGAYGLFSVGNGSSGNTTYNSGCQFSGVSNINVVVLQDGGGGEVGPIWNNTQLTEGGGLMGKAFVCRGNGSGSCQTNFTGVTNVSVGAQNQGGHTLTPGIWCVECGRFNAERLMLSARGGINASAVPAGMKINIGMGRDQGGSIPVLVLAGAWEGGNAGVGVNLSYMGGMEPDTMSQPCVSYLPGAGTVSGGLTIGGCSPNPGFSQITGTRFDTLSGGSGQNRNTSLGSSGPAHDAIFTGGNFSAVAPNYLINQPAAATLAMPNYPIGTMEPPQPAPPTTISAGGNISVGPHNLNIVPVWWNGGEGSTSATTTVTTTTGNQTLNVSWTPTSVPPLGYNIYVDGVAPNGICNSVFAPCVSGTTTSVVISSIPFAEFTSGAGPTASPTMAFGNSIYSPFIKMSETPAPSNPVSGLDLLYADNTTHRIGCLTNTGANCLFPYLINSYGTSHTLTINEQAVEASASGITFTLPHAAANRHWDISNPTSGTITLAIDSGTLSGNGATGSITIAANTGWSANCDGTNCNAFGGGGGGGGGCSPGGLTDALQYNGGGTCSFGGVNSPTVNGNYVVNYNVVAGAAVPPTINLPGVPQNVQTGTTYTYLFSDRGSRVTANNSGAQTYTLTNPSSAGFGQNYFNLLHNIGTGAVTDTASGFTIDGGTTLLVPPNWTRWLYSDGVNYFSARLPDFKAFPNCTGGGNALQFTTSTGAFSCGAAASGVSAINGDGALISNSGSTGTVTLTLANAGGHKYWGNNTGSSAAPGYVSIVAGDLPATVVLTNQANTYTTGLQDLSAATLKIPTGAGCTAGASAMICYDSTNKNWHIYDNNADAIGLAIASAPTTGDLASYSVVSGNVLAADSGVVAANVVTAPSAAAAANQLCVSGGATKTCSYIDYPDIKIVPAANCVNGAPGAGWSIGSGGTVTCRAGTNNLGGFISITDTASTFATFQTVIPEDWNSAANPYIRFQIASTDAVNSHTIIPSIQVACYKGDGSTTDDVAPNAAHSLSTTTLNGNANRFWSTSNVQMNSTDVTGCVAGALMQITVGRATDTATNAEFYSATLTFPRRVVVQAN